MFKVNNKDTRATSNDVAAGVLSVNFEHIPCDHLAHLSTVFFHNFEHKFA